MITLKRDNVEIIVDSEERAQKAISEGFSRIGKPSAELPDFSAMTKSELIAYAYEMGIDIDRRAKKADILAAVK